MQSKSQISTHKAQKMRDQIAYGTVGASPETKGTQNRIETHNQHHNQAKSLSNGSRHKYTTH